ncbi:MAG: hypothetical protein PVG14_11755 [Anaerolineales bacterium]|jgi:hypothetical protein
MLLPNLHAVECIMEERVRGSLQQAQVHLWLLQAGLEQRSWMRRKGCRLLSSLGHSMVSLGRWLERFETSSTTLVSSGGTGKAHG